MRVPPVPLRRMQALLNSRVRPPASPAFTLSALGNASAPRKGASDAPEVRMTIRTSKKVFGRKAVVRNRATRRLRAAFGSAVGARRRGGAEPAVDILVHGAVPSLSRPWEELLGDAEGALSWIEAKTRAKRRPRRATPPPPAMGDGFTLEPTKK